MQAVSTKRCLDLTHMRAVEALSAGFQLKTSDRNTNYDTDRQTLCVCMCVCVSSYTKTTYLCEFAQVCM